VLLEGGGEAVLLAGLDLPSSTRCTTVLGGAPAALDAITGANPGTIVVAVDVAPAAGAAAALVGGTTGTEVVPLARTTRSLPVRVRDAAGHTNDYDDPRLLRARGVAVAVEQLDLPTKPIGIAGLSAKDASSYLDGPASALPTLGAAAALFALADAVEQHRSGVLVAVEQASATAAEVTAGDTALARVAPAPRALQARRPGGDADIKISLAAYERAFDGKLRLAAGKCDACGALHLPQRYRCTECGSEAGSSLAALPRTGTVYTAVSVHVPVPGLQTPYDLAIVELGDSGIRLLAPVTGADPGAVSIDDVGTVVLRRMAVRSGVPDYGYAFQPATPSGASV
jgi:uncharacterized OB-fold protein